MELDPPHRRRRRSTARHRHDRAARDGGVTAKPDAHLTLQLVVTTVSYAQPRLGGSISFNSVHLSLPTVTGVTVVTP